MTKRYLCLAAVVASLYAGRFLYAQDWKSILPVTFPPPTAKPLEKAQIIESGELTPRQALGQRLFFDPILSSDGKRSCSTCHDSEHGFASHGRPVGTDGYLLPRRAPSLYGKSEGKTFFWDGRQPTLEDQCREVLLNQKEMGNRSMDELLTRLSRKYKWDFDWEYAEGFTAKTVVKALTDYERTISNPSDDFENFLAGRNTYTEEQGRGYDLFRSKARCYLCHPTGGPARRLTDEDFHNTGLRANARGIRDVGRFNVTRRSEDEGKFKTPGLRGCGLTGPYMHDGSLKTLEEVVEFYDRGGDREGEYVGEKDYRIVPLRLTGREKKDLVEFLKGL